MSDTATRQEVTAVAASSCLLHTHTPTVRLPGHLGSFCPRGQWAQDQGHFPAPVKTKSKTEFLQVTLHKTFCFISFFSWLFVVVVVHWTFALLPADIPLLPLLILDRDREEKREVEKGGETSLH